MQKRVRTKKKKKIYKKNEKKWKGNRTNGIERNENDSVALNE